ncbi:MAG TPA: hypothetical protein VND45_01470 [Thermoanaerobaculia bacterium]|jgi:hypothetical protein|nr:hypothetical protein [Thermoanaerobaculia bacterium]
MYEGLKEFMLELATNLDRLSEFVASPRPTAEAAGLGEDELDVLFSGDQGRIYLALAKGESAPPRPPEADAPQQQAPQPQPFPQPQAAQGAQQGQQVYYAYPQMWPGGYGQQPQVYYVLTAWPGPQGWPAQTH